MQDKINKLKNRLLKYNGYNKNDIIPIYLYEINDINDVEECIKRYAKEYKEVYTILLQNIYKYVKRFTK